MVQGFSCKKSLAMVLLQRLKIVVVFRLILEASLQKCAPEDVWLGKK